MSFFQDYFTSKSKAEKKKETPDIVTNLFKVPQKDKGVNMPHFQNVSLGTQQADLLFLPEDQGYKYALVVVENHNRKTDAQPLKEKTAEAVKTAFKAIYKRGIVKMPTLIEVDSGKEFQGVVKQYFDEHKVNIRVAKTARHRQQALVEKKNFTIGRALLKRQAAQELVTHQPSTEWIDDLPDLIKHLNKHTKATFKPLTVKEAATKDPVCKGDACNLLSEGTKVRAILEHPKNAATGAKEFGRFRAGDIRWETKPSTIASVVIKPGFPPLYLLTGDKDHVAYTKNQLQVVHKDEKFPKPETFIRNASKIKEYVVEKFLAKKTEDRKIKYRIKWLGYPADQSTWQSRKALVEDLGLARVKELEKELISRA
jgi:CRISPR/Cas system CMR-associated protein Cmr5 small subunit